MEPSKEAIAVRITRLNRQILGKVTSGMLKFSKKTIDREALLDALTVLYDECNDDPVKKSDDLVRAFVDKYRSTLAELRRTRVCLSDFKILETIGRGHFAEVHMVREKQTGDVYALKTLRKEEARKRAIASTEDERDVLANANSPWIPRLQYAFQDNSNLYLVMELCSGGDLAGLLSRRTSPLSERDSAFYVAEVAQALKVLHGMGYVHRDVKPHNILLDRCGHVKLGDLGSCGRLSEGSCAGAGAPTPDYVAPELLAAADCASRHTSACDYWSLGVVAFELVTLRRPFSVGDEDTLVEILSNIQKYESDPNSEPPFDPAPRGPSAEWRALVAGLLRVQPARRYNYLDTLQHAALSHLPLHSIRDQVPPWVPCVRGPEDASYFSPAPRATPPPSVTMFRTRPPFAGQLPFLGYSYVAPEEGEDSISGFSTSHDCTAIDLATFKSAEKLAAMRSKEIESLQNKLAAAEASAGAALERTRRELDADAERQRARMQGEITALTLQNKRLERQVEVEKEERMALQRTNQQLSAGITERNSAEVRGARAEALQLQAERDALRGELQRLEGTVRDLQAECTRALAAADAQRMQHQHYKESVAKERAIRRQTLSGGDSEREGREAGARLANAEANTAREVRARELLQKRFATLQEEHAALQTEFDQTKRELTKTREALNEKQLSSDTSSNQLKDIQRQLAQEKLRSTTLSSQVQELERGLEDSVRRETILEEQCTRTEARLNERLQAAETRANNALQEDSRHREKVNSLEQLVRRLEREVTALETRGCARCAARARPESEGEGASRDGQREREREEEGERTRRVERAGRGERTEEESARVRVSTDSASRGDAHSDTESVVDAAHAQLSLLKEQLERAEAQLQARAEEIATLRQETRAANLARWRKEREYNELSVEAKSSARDLKRLEERLSSSVEVRKAAELKANSLQNEITLLKPQYEEAKKSLDKLTEQLQKLQKTHETAQAEVDRSRNDIRKLKSELQYSEKRRMHAEEQEELSSRERAQLRDEMLETRHRTNELVENNKALQEACSLLEEQLNDLEKLTDVQEIQNKDLESELQRMRGEMESWRTRALDAEKLGTERSAAAEMSATQHEQACERAAQANTQVQLLKERLESREKEVIEMEIRVATLENEVSERTAASEGATRRLRDLHEECAALRTAAHHHHATALRLQAALADAQEELAAAREAADAASAWWRTRETKAEATLRQQAKLIDFLQAKVEELGRKKCSLGNKLFGRSGRRPATSPPLRRANRELREEVERLRSKLAALKNENDCPPTPQRAKPKKPYNGVSVRNIEMTDEIEEDNSLQIVWADGERERMRVRSSGGALVLSGSGREVRAKLHSHDANNLPQNEANRAFTVKFDNYGKTSEAAVVCSSMAERAQWVSKLQPTAVPSGGYTPSLLARYHSQPAAALHIESGVVAIGCSDGLHSLRGAVTVELDSDLSPPRRARVQGVSCINAAAGRALVVYNGLLVQGGLIPMESALRRAGNLKPTLNVSRVKLPDGTPPHLIKSVMGDAVEGPCVAVACGRRVFLLRFDASTSEFKISRSLTIDRQPTSLLLTTRYLFITGEKPLKINLPSGALESFAIDEPTVAAAAKKQSPPKAILMIRDQPLEIFLCYAECGVFVDENGKRTRNEDPKWSSAVHGWEFVNPFLYIIGEEKITIIYLSDEAYKSPPCTCETTSLTSTSTDCYVPRIFNLKVNEPALMGTTPNGIIIRSKVDDEFSVFVVEGLAAFRSIGASVESLDTIPDTKRSSSDLGPSLSDSSPHEVSRESIEATTGFLADIRKRARQLRSKNRIEETEQTSDDVIKRILTSEVGLKRTSMSRKSPATNSEFDSDSTESEEQTGSTKCTADLCAEMFTKQVKFQ